MRRRGSSTRVHGLIGIPGWGVIPLRRCPSVNWVERIIECANSPYPGAEPSTATTQETKSPEGAELRVPSPRRGYSGFRPGTSNENDTPLMAWYRQVRGSRLGDAGGREASHRQREHSQRRSSSVQHRRQQESHRGQSESNGLSLARTSSSTLAGALHMNRDPRCSHEALRN